MTSTSDETTDAAHCSEEELRAWFRNELDEESEQRIERHLMRCDVCAKKIDEVDVWPEPIVNRFGVPRDPATETRMNLPAIHESKTETELEWSRERESMSHGSDGSSTNGANTSTSRWQPELLLASGGIGEVWVALDRQLGRTVALKKLKREFAGIPSVRRRFLQEARVTAQLTHPGTASVYELCEDGPESFYVMTLVEGKSLASLIQELHRTENPPQKLTPAWVSLIQNWISVARTISFAHTKGVVHRDLKSDNIIVGDYAQVTVIDWGLAKRTDQVLVEDHETEPPTGGASSQMLRSTRPGMRMGTPPFMAPEQARGENHVVDEQTDVWGLGAMLYEILTGVAPFTGTGTDDVLQKVLHEPLVAIRRHRPGVPVGLTSLCEKALQKEKSSRWPTVQDFANAVESWINADREIRESTTARQKLFELSGELMFIFDFDSRIVWGNTAWERQLGWSSEQWVGSASESLVHPEDRMPDARKQQIRLGETVVHESRIRHVDGSYHWYSWHFTAVPDEKQVYAVGYRLDRPSSRSN
ncbi:MAG: protein kinase [Planctomycetota bacterium]